MFDKPHGGIYHKIGIVCGATGILWPMWWTGGSKAFLAIVTSTIGYILLPIAFLAFFIMMNSKKVLKDGLPKGNKKLIWNIMMGVSLLVTGAAAAHTATTKSLSYNGDPIMENGVQKLVEGVPQFVQEKFPIGIVGLITFIVLVIIGQIYMNNKHKNAPAEPEEAEEAPTAE
jgi:hypothetical protein